jgi:[protein-PII] uridylyltransferase
LTEPEKAIYPTSRLPRRQLKHFQISPRVRFDQDSKHGRTIMEVVSADRPGLLSRVGWALASCNAWLLNAKIATFGERAEDVFFVSDRDGGPLSAEQCESLRANIVRALEPPAAGGKRA